MTQAASSSRRWSLPRATALCRSACFAALLPFEVLSSQDASGEPREAAASSLGARDFFRYMDDIWQRFESEFTMDDLTEDSRRLTLEDQIGQEIEPIYYNNLTWVPPLDLSPPGAFGGPCLYAGTNYTSWRINASSNMSDGGRLRLVRPDLQPPGAPAGHCLREEFNYIDILPPLDGSVEFEGGGTEAWYYGGIYFAQGGQYKLCFSPRGTFADPEIPGALGDASIVPDGYTEFRVLGVQDTCDHGQGCLLRRRFFCHLPHVAYLDYIPYDYFCDTFVQYTSSPLLYSRLAVMDGDNCGRALGPALEANRRGVGVLDWARIVDPVSLIDLGKARTDLQDGFHYLLCFCAAFDASEGRDLEIDGVCGQLDDFTQQVGVIDGLMTSFLDVSANVVEQVVPMTRFSIRVDCGGGFDSCEDLGLESIKVIPRAWGAVDSPIGYTHWNTSNTCPYAIETEFWYSPENCVDANGNRLQSNCKDSGGTSKTEKIFGLNETRFHPLIDSGGAGVLVAQMFDICFVHKDPAVDGLRIRQFEPYSDDALQEVTRTFFKVGQLVVEPLVLYGADTWVMTKPSTVRIGPPNLQKTSNLHESSVFNRSANGSNPVGPIIKVILEEAGKTGTIDQFGCFNLFPDEATITGLFCNQTWCTPRATKVGEELVLNGGNPNFDLTVEKAGIAAVCYCEAWPFDDEACTRQEEWLLVGKFLISGPTGTQEWTLDRGMIQSLEIIGFALKDTNTVRILDEGANCDANGFDRVASFVRWCSAANKGICISHGPESNATHVADIPGALWRWNSTDPPAYIESIVPASDGRGTMINFPYVPLIKVDDRIHIEDNIVPRAEHWVRQRDLAYIVKGQEIGHEAQELQNADRRVRVEMQLDPFPELDFHPPKQGRWYRSNKLKVPDIKGTKEISQLAVCWAETPGDYFAWAGYINFVNPNYLEKITVGLTSTAQGATAPIIITFTTGDNPQYLAPIHSMQLRLTFTNTSTFAPMFASFEPEPFVDGEFRYADQMHEASQSVCGRVFLELYSEFEFGFPVPIGCYVDTNRYGSEGRIIAIYMLFEPLNGLKASTKYSIVMNAQNMVPMEMWEYDALEDGLIELATLDDIKIKPEGIVDVGWGNPDKAIQVSADRSNESTDMRWFQGGLGGIILRKGVSDELLEEDDLPADQHTVSLDGRDYFGIAVVIRGEENGKIVQGSLLRLVVLPLTAFDFDYREKCKASCIPHYAHWCTTHVECKLEAAMSECTDFVPPLQKAWIDTRGRGCEYYAEPGKCLVDGEAFTPIHGYSAIFSCCACDGGIRANMNIVKLELPERMDPAFTSETMHTIRVWEAAPLPKRGFFPTRMGAQISTKADTLPDYTQVAGRYLVKTPDPDYINPVSSLIGMDGWGNSRQFSADPKWNDIYLRMQMPLTLRGATGTHQGVYRSTASFEIILPQGYECKHVDEAYPPGEGADQIAMPWLSTSAPQGSGIIPGASSRAGGNLSAPGVVRPSGDWEFKDNRCIFYLSPDMVLYDKQRLFFYIWAKNPILPMPKNDPINVWRVRFQSSGDWGMPENLSLPCKPYFPPFCNDTGELYYVSPVSKPTALRSFDLMYPNYTDLEMQHGDLALTVGFNESDQYTESYAVLGILRQTVCQPQYLHLTARSSLQLWFRPELGSDRGGYFGVHAPTSFDFGDPCKPRNLPNVYYSSFAPPGKPIPQRVWPIEDMGSCYPAKPPSWHAKGIYVVIDVAGSMIPGRLYAMEIDIVNPSVWTDANLSGEFWSFDMSIEDGLGYGRDSTYWTTPFHPGVKPSWTLFQETAWIDPIPVIFDTLPYSHTSLLSTIDIGPIILNLTFEGQLRITAPLGYEWAWDPRDTANTFIWRNLPGAAAFPGKVPPLPSDDRPNVIVWDQNHTYVEGVPYALRTLMKVPDHENATSGQAFWFEWGLSLTSFFHRYVGARTPADPIRALRNAKVESTDIVKGHTTTIWLFVETVTRIEKEGSLEVIWPFHKLKIKGFRDLTDDFIYIKVRAATDYGSKSFPPDLRARQVYFPNSVKKPGNFLGDDLKGEMRLEFRANRSGIDPGLYVFEINGTNPEEQAVNPPDNSAMCLYTGCLTWYSKTETFSPITFDVDTNLWKHNSIISPDWKLENDYKTSVKSQQIANPMQIAGIVNLTLDERLACGRDDRPKKRSALVIGFALNEYKSITDELLHVRAPIGWEFDSDCDLVTAANEVYPAPAERPAQIALQNDTVLLPVHDWPRSAVVKQCRGDMHHAFANIGKGLEPKKVYLFRIGIKRNPLFTPLSNTWSITIGTESSGAIPGFPVWTFPGVRLEPVLLGWTNKSNPTPAPIAIYLEATNWLYHFNPPLMPLIKLTPMIRIVMPPQYEFLVNAEDQDMQGKACYLVIQREGNCRLCGVPFGKDQIRCRREWNRKNAAHVTLTDKMVLQPGLQYSIWITVINPHSRDAVDSPLNEWAIESFFGDPAPPAVAPVGYWLDQVFTPGYRISGLAKMTIEKPESTDGGAMVDWIEFTMKFGDLLIPGDYIIVRAPVGFELSFLIPGFNSQLRCYGFQWLPTIWPPPLPDDVDELLIPEYLRPVYPPVRPPLPPSVPDWAGTSNVVVITGSDHIEDSPKWAAGSGAWVLRMPINFTDALIADFEAFLNFLNSNESNGSNMSILNYTAPTEVELVSTLGVPDWALNATVEAQIETAGNGSLSNVSTEYLVIRSHCMDYNATDAGGFPLMGDFDWNKVPRDADFFVDYDLRQFVFRSGLLTAVISNGMVENITYNASELRALNLSNISNFTNASLGPEEIVEEYRVCLRTEFRQSRYEFEPNDAGNFCLRNCSGSNGTERTACMEECLYTPLPREATRCFSDPAGSVPDAARGVAAQILDPPACRHDVLDYLEAVEERERERQKLEQEIAERLARGQSIENLTNTSNASAPELVMPECECGMPGDIQIAVAWRSKVDLSKQVDAFREEYLLAKRLLELDSIPLQPPPMCLDNELTLVLTEDDLHPEAKYVNTSVTFRFRMKFLNPRRPPLDHQNYWNLLHRRPTPGVPPDPETGEIQTDVYSSDAVKSWLVVSKLRYVTIDRITEVLRPTDFAVIHIEFVTVNPADLLTIQAVSPEGFDFSQVKMHSKGTNDPKPPNVGGRRLLWQGFTDGINVLDRSVNQCRFTMTLDKIEYVRFQIGGVRIPWTGGQALFNLYTTISGFPADTMENCCQEGEPKHNPASVFKVPYRLKNLRGSALNEWHLEALKYPIASTMETRLNELHVVKFTWLLDADLEMHPLGNEIRVIVRAPLGWQIVGGVKTIDFRDSLFYVADPGDVTGEGERMRSVKFRLVERDELRIQLALGKERTSLSADLEYQAVLSAMSPALHTDRAENDLWVIELTDDYSVSTGEVAMHKGSFDDFTLLSQVNFTVDAPRSPPEVTIMVEVTIYELGEPSEYPNRVDVYAPSGFKFLLNCFFPGESERLRGILVSCRERWTLFQGKFLSGAILMAADNGITPERLPLKVKLILSTPALTPLRNDFFIRTHQRLGPAAWGMKSGSFPISSMEVTPLYTGVAGTSVPMFIALQIRYDIPWGGYIHLSAPLTYKIRCPITKVLLAPDFFVLPTCTNNDPILNGCFGLPTVGDADANPLFPLCEPEHEVLLIFEKPDPEETDISPESLPAVALEGGASVLWSIDIQVADQTPQPRSSNIFRIRTLDPNKVPMDGNMWLPGEQVREVPVAADFEIWFTRPVPSSITTVAIHFTFNRTTPRELEEPGHRLVVIEIVAPQGLEMKVRRPRDVQLLKRDGGVPVNEWNWTNTMPRQLWFGLDVKQNVTGTFHYAFPVLTPSEEVGFPYNNLWEVRFCTDAPFCTTKLLSVPIPGFFFGEDPEKDLSPEAQEMLTGSGAWRRATPTVLQSAVVVMAVVLSLPDCWLWPPWPS
eukprot:TRINITY_DN28018_c0_g1_i1.p1 TRINITY_DN28018_c0_g1~~TRINITY_DN28018_c0_g1_i1.p1  ORF type:complete len:3899 (-),score=525.31 TRINITY_DN28018_c0_g1_i1:23-11719(-)